MKTQSRVRRVGAAALSATVMATLMVSGGAAPASADCPLVPTLRDYTINQGLGSYSPLTRGKETLARFYLSKPQCDTSSAVIEVTRATLSIDGAPLPIASVPAAASPFQPIAPWTASPVADSAADPKFVVAGELVDRPDAVFRTTFDLGFKATVHYQVRPAPGAAVTSMGAVDLDKDPVTSAPIKATFGKRPDALRILVVPMGNAAESFTSQFPTEAVQSVQTAMQTASRLLPVPDGVGPLTTTGTEGIRYALAPKMLDVTKWMTAAGGKFCPADSEDVGAALETELSVFNSETGNRAADRVVGVIWHSISAGTEVGCYDGWAHVRGRGAWARTFPVGTADRSGAVLTHEILHTFGDVADARVDSFSAYHTKNSQADTTAPNRGYNLATREYIADDKAIMRLGPNWRDETVLLEREDWTMAQCTLTDGSLATACPRPGGVGGALAGPSFVVTGRTDGTPGGSDLHSYYGDSAFRPEPEATSTYRLVQRGPDKSTVLKNEGVPVSTDSVRDDAGGGSQGHSGDLIDFATEVAESADPARRAEWFQLYRGDPQTGTATLLYERRRGSPPRIVTSSFGPTPGPAENFTNSPLVAEGGAALSPDGTLVAWQGPAGVVVSTRSGGASIPVLGATDVDFDAGGTRITYVRNGSVYVRGVSVSDDGVLLGTERIVYNASLQNISSGPASGPTFSPNGEQIGMALNGDIWAVSVDFPFVSPDPLICEVTSTLDQQGCERLTRDPRPEREPDWSESNRIAYVVDGFDGGSPVGIITVLERGSGEVVDSGLRGTSPSWGAELLAFATAGGISTAAWRESAGHLEFAQPLALTTGEDSSPSLASSGTAAAFIRTFDGQSDVFLVGFERRTITVQMTDPEGTAHLRADVLLDCMGDDLTYVLFAGLRPAAVSGGVATFTANYDPAMACDGDVVVRGTDGFNTVTEIVGQLRKRRGPVAAIAVPAPGTVLLEHEALPARGAALDPDGEISEGSTFVWELRGPGGLHLVLGDTPVLDDQDPPAGGWPVGNYTLTLTVTYRGESSEATTSFTIVADDDGDRLPPPLDGCGASRDNDPTNVYEDDDRDGIVNLDDSQPCLSDNNATADFEPNTLYVPSAGSSVTVYLRSSTVSLSSVRPDTVAITQVGQWAVWLPATAWSVSKGVATVKFDKQVLSAFLAQKGLVGQYVPVAVTASSTSGPIRAVDPTAPYTSPA